jgi:hypothetical protein
MLTLADAFTEKDTSTGILRRVVRQVQAPTAANPQKLGGKSRVFDSWPPARQEFVPDFTNPLHAGAAIDTPIPRDLWPYFGTSCV